jgi:hypothetical protein
MSIENLLWGAPRIHGELLKLGFELAQSSVAKYMVKRRGSPSQGWHTFLRNHAPDIAAMDLFVVPTLSFDLLYALMRSERTGRWTKMHRFRAPYSGPDQLNHTRSSAASITITSGFRFSVHTGGS